MDEITTEEYEDFKKLIEDVINAFGDDRKFFDEREECLNDEGIDSTDHSLYFWATLDLTDEEYCRIRNKIINFVWFDTRKLCLDTRYGDIKGVYYHTRGFGNNKVEASYRNLRFLFYKGIESIENNIQFE